jgi:hypothetical protein
MAARLTGDRARALLDAVIERVQPHLPTEVRAIHTSVSNGLLRMWAVAATDPFQEDDSLVRVDVDLDRRSRSIASRGPMYPFGIAPRFPLLPRKLAARMLAQAAVQDVQKCIESVTGFPWPAVGATVKTASNEDEIRVWFAGADGRQLLVLPPLECSLLAS